MKIIELRAENIKRLIAVAIKPISNVVEITGKNGNGKTSVLDSIWWALTGAKNIQLDPIRKGQTQGKIRIEIGENGKVDLIVERLFEIKEGQEYTTKLIVTNGDGIKVTSPQAVIDKFLGDLSFDPLAFARASSDEQFNKLRQFVPDIDFKAIDAANKKDYENRTDLNRRAKERRAAAAQITIDSTCPAEPIDETVLVEEMAKAGEHNADITVRQNNRNNLEREIINNRQKIKDLEFQIKQIQLKLDAAPALPEPIDVSELQANIIKARSINSAIALREQKQSHEITAQQLETSAADLTKQIEKRDADKQEKVSAAKLPVPGISFGEGIILLNGVPFEQASDAEQLKASISIAMALNPKLRVIRVRDGSLLDDDSMRIVAQMADEHNCQCWLERVDGSGKVGFVLEEGLIKENPVSDEPDVF